MTHINVISSSVNSVSIVTPMHDPRVIFMLAVLVSWLPCVFIILPPFSAPMLELLAF